MDRATAEAVALDLGEYFLTEIEQADTGGWSVTVWRKGASTTDTPLMTIYHAEV